MRELESSKIIIYYPSIKIILKKKVEDFIYNFITRSKDFVLISISHHTK